MTIELQRIMGEESGHARMYRRRSSEHQTYDEIRGEICRRHGIDYDGTLISRFHAIHLDERRSLTPTG